MAGKEVSQRKVFQKTSKGEVMSSMQLGNSIGSGDILLIKEDRTPKLMSRDLESLSNDNDRGEIKLVVSEKRSLVITEAKIIDDELRDQDATSIPENESGLFPDNMILINHRSYCASDDGDEMICDTTRLYKESDARRLGLVDDYHNGAVFQMDDLN